MDRSLQRLLVIGGCLAAVVMAACSAKSSPPASSAGAGGDNTSGPTSTTGQTTASNSASSTGSGGGGADDCVPLCATEAKLMCKNTTADSCKAGCEILKGEISWCSSIAATAVDCLSKQPMTSFACDMNGEAQANSGVCENAVAAMHACWFNGPPAGLPDLTKACSDACANEAALACANPQCDSDCMKGIMPGQKCNGALAALVSCDAKQPAPNFACDMEMPPVAGVKQGFCDFEALILAACLQ